MLLRNSAVHVVTSVARRCWLIERPWQGYEFHQVLTSAVGPARQVSWGTIYPLLQRLEKAGLIQQLSDLSDSMIVRPQVADGPPAPEKEDVLLTIQGCYR